MTPLKFFSFLAVATAVNATLGPSIVSAQNSPPLSGSWNIAPTGKAASSGELLFRVTPGDGADPVEVTVFVLSGSNETGIASTIRRNFTLQLDAADFDVQTGEGSNVRVTSQAGSGANFAVELLDSDVENVRVTVQSIAPVAPPTVPSQSTPANPPDQAAPANQPQAPGDANPPQATPPQSTQPQSPAPASPSAPPAQNSAPPSVPSTPANPQQGGAGEAASPPPGSR